MFVLHKKLQNGQFMPRQSIPFVRWLTKLTYCYYDAHKQNAMTSNEIREKYKQKYKGYVSLIQKRKIDAVPNS